MLYGFDIGGTKIEFSVYNQDLQQVLNTRVETPKHDYQAVIELIAGLVAQADADYGVRGKVGIGFPGVINTTDNTLVCANLPAVSDKNLQRDLEARIDRVVAVQNDANCFLLSECHGGAADGADTAVGVTLGTGVGGAVYVNGQLHSGRNFFAGEIGHFPIPATVARNHPELPLFQCGCGRKGCLETYVSGTGLGNLYQHVAGEALKGPQILEKYRAGDAVAAQVVELYMEILAEGLATVITTLDPDVLVFGGGLAAFDEIYTRLPKMLPALLLPGVRLPQLRQAVFGGAGGVRGAALLNYKD